MQRYLLFDSDCAACTSVAQSIERILGGWLTACSLRHPRMMQLLDRARPKWGWEPTLLEIEGDQVRAFTGISLAAKTAAGVGLLRALSVLRLVANATRAKAKASGLSRRGFLSSGLTLLTMLAIPRFLRPGRAARSDPESPKIADIGELYGGFVLLPDGAPLPVEVSGDYKGFPNPCGVVEPGGSEHTEPSDAVHVDLTDARRFSAMAGIPVYGLEGLPQGLTSVRASIVKDGTGEVHGGYLSYSATDARNKVNSAAVTIAVEKGFPHPYPLWSAKPVEEGGPSIELEKVDYVPGGEGVMIRTTPGFDLLWIANDVLHHLSAENVQGIEPGQLAALLKPMD